MRIFQPGRMNGRLRARLTPCLLVLALLVLCLTTGCAGQSSSEKQNAAPAPADSGEAEGPKDLPLWAKAVSVPGGYLYLNKNTGEIYACDSTVTKVDIPEEIEGIQVTAIGSGAFKNCTGLVRVSIPDCVERIVSQAFENCTSLTDVRLPDTLTTLEDSTFENCSALTEIKLPDGLKTIGDDAFKNCTGLSDAAIPSTVRFIKNEAFSGCGSLAGVTLPDQLWELGDRAFYGCSALKKVVIPGELINIQSSAFEGCSGLEELTIENGVESIWDHAFAGCSGLTGVFLPASVQDIEVLAFDGCENLTEFTVDGENEYFTTVSGVLFNKEISELIEYPFGAFVRDKEYNLGLLPSALSAENYDIELLPESTLNPSVLKKENIRVVPLLQDGELNGVLYCLLPENSRALSWRDADYALVQIRTLTPRDDYVYAGTFDQALAYDATTSVYLCASDGSFAEVFSVTNEPPATGTIAASGEYATSAEIWESISALFRLDAA